MKLLKIKTVFISFFFIFSACQYNNKEEVSVVYVDDYKEEKIALNREFVRRENADIELIAKRYEWNLTRTESGLYYQIVNKTEGEYPKKRNIVKIKGSIMLANGKEIYNSKTDGLKEFAVEQSDEPIGLHELVKLMRVGEKSNAIIPSNLVYGLTGDGYEIPPAASLICKLELVSIK
jgi:FKBP-type peptidyl-prolyl cis-trans isomerase